MYLETHTDSRGNVDVDTVEHKKLLIVMCVNTHTETCMHAHMRAHTQTNTHTHTHMHVHTHLTPFLELPVSTLD